MVINGLRLFQLAPIKNMVAEKKVFNGRSYGLSEVGYDIRLKQNVIFNPRDTFVFSGNQETHPSVVCWENEKPISNIENIGNFCLASTIEEFNMPNNLVGVVHDKSTNIRKGIQVFNTVVEPGWKGFLTLEIAFHGNKPIVLEAGTPIAQVIFHELYEEAEYKGKYQNQEDKPVEAKYETNR